MHRKKPIVPSAVNSAAIQDHILRQYALTTNPVRKNSGFSRNAKSILKLSTFDEITKKTYEYNNKLTLAQRLGIVAKPDAPLSHQQWAEVEKKSEQREEYKGQCPICQEHLGRDLTVILSCTHVFHKQCIQSFEKFSKTKACPICRKQSYEKKSYKTAQDYYYIYCITKVQAWVRGFICREKFIRYMTAHPSKNKNVQRKYAEIQMRRLNLKIGLHLDKREKSIDKIFEQLENQLFESQAAVKALKGISRNRENEKSDFDWTEARIKALKRCDKNCPICLQELEIRRETTVLSCSHVFHKKCIESFENFSIQNPACPVCRSQYIRTKL